MRINLSVIKVFKKNNLNSEVVTQLLYGDTFKKIKQVGSWIKIKNDKDNYKGYIKNKNFLPNQKNTHKISSLSAKIYSMPNIKSQVKMKLSFGSKIKVIKKNGKYYRFDNLWIEKKNLKKINDKNKSIFNNINKFIGVRYKWGGKHYSGIDCSALVQLCLNFNNRFCPRDSKDQIKFFKNKISFKNIKKNDLIFWRGHVAVVISKKKLVHAYGPFKKVLIMPIKKTINRIYETANLKVIGIRRIK